MIYLLGSSLLNEHLKGNQSSEKSFFLMDFHNTGFLFNWKRRSLLVSEEIARFKTLPHWLHEAEREVATTSKLITYN